MQENLQDDMRDEYDIKSLNPRKNPYAERLKQQKPQTTITINNDIVDYFKEMSEDVGISYLKLIELYLSDCVANKKQLNLSWK